MIVAAVGGWLIGHRTLRPLTADGGSTGRVNERDPKERLAVPPVDDELARLADRSTSCSTGWPPP